MEVVISNIIEFRSSSEKELCWLSCKTQTGSKIVFWGSPEDGQRNIDALRHQKMPVLVTLESPEECQPSDYVRREYGASISVPEHSWIQINPEH